MTEDCRKKFVVDASVVIKWLNEEEKDHEYAEKVKDDFLNKQIELLVPNLFGYEILNYLGRRCPEKANEIYSFLLNLRLDYVELGMEVVIEALEIMNIDKKISFYEASYHAVAVKLDAVYLTADEKYVSLVHKRGNVMRLTEY